MRRFKHGINTQNSNASDFFKLCPLQYIEVAPGETLQGTFQSRLWSDTTTKPVLNRTYFDTYAFYVPFRLLWPDFPEFIANSESGLQVPTVTSAFPLNFEKKVLGANGTNPATSQTAWMRRAYNLIWNTYFRAAGEDERAQDDNSEALTYIRPSTFHESIRAAADISSEPIPTGTLDDLRQSFAKDRFDKLRSFYGAKYTDYLAALGVEASWSILDDPEMLGQKHADLPYRVVNATATGETLDTGVGDPAGYFDGVNTLKMRRTFCPEHGLICVYGVAKMDTWALNGHVHPVLCKTSQSQYWSPEFAAETIDQWPEQLWVDNSVLTDTYPMPKYADYMKGGNLLGKQKAFATAGYLATYTAQDAVPDYRQRNQADYASLFTGSLYDPVVAQYQVTVKTAVTKVSPIGKGRSAVY